MLKKRLTVTKKWSQETEKDLQIKFHFFRILSDLAPFYFTLLLRRHTNGIAFNFFKFIHKRLIFYIQCKRASTNGQQLVRKVSQIIIGSFLIAFSANKLKDVHCTIPLTNRIRGFDREATTVIRPCSSTTTVLTNKNKDNTGTSNQYDTKERRRHSYKNRETGVSAKQTTWKYYFNGLWVKYHRNSFLYHWRNLKESGEWQVIEKFFYSTEKQWYFQSLKPY